MQAGAVPQTMWWTRTGRQAGGRSGGRPGGSSFAAPTQLDMQATMETGEEPLREVPYDALSPGSEALAPACERYRTTSSILTLVMGGAGPTRLRGNAVLAESRGFQRRKLFPFSGLLAMCACAPLRPS